MAKKYKILVHNCPLCGSKRVNPIDDKNSFCVNCLVEFSFTTGKLYTIMYDGILVDSYENEFMNCG